MLKSFELFIYFVMGYFYVFASKKGYQFTIPLAAKTQFSSVRGSIVFGSWKIAHVVTLDKRRNVLHGVIKAKRLPNTFQCVQQLFLVPIVNPQYKPL